MESSTGVNSINCDTGSPLKHCIDLVNKLADKGLRFSISVKIENSFVFQLQSKDAAKAPKANKRSPSYKRRQEKRRLLRKKSDTFREKPVSMNTEHQRHSHFHRRGFPREDCNSIWLTAKPLPETSIPENIRGFS